MVKVILCFWLFLIGPSAVATGALFNVFKNLVRPPTARQVLNPKNKKVWGNIPESQAGQARHAGHQPATSYDLEDHSFPLKDQILKDGVEQLLSEVGREDKTRPGSWDDAYYPSGRVRQARPSVQRRGKKNSSGSQAGKYPDGSFVTSRQDGSKVIHYPDGSKWIVYPDGLKKFKYPFGLWLIYPAGSQVPKVVNL